MKKSSFVIGLLSLTSISAFAHSWYQTDVELKIGERDGVCDVVAQLELGPGSQPLIVDKATDICNDIYSRKLIAGQTVKALLNGNTQIVNCFICAGTK